MIIMRLTWKRRTTHGCEPLIALPKLTTRAGGKPSVWFLKLMLRLDKYVPKYWTPIQTAEVSDGRSAIRSLHDTVLLGPACELSSSLPPGVLYSSFESEQNGP